MKNQFIILLFTLAVVGQGFAQNNSPEMISGQVVEQATDGSDGLPLIGAHVHWLGSGHGTATDLDGNFEIQKEPGVDQLIVSYTGYQSDTVLVSGHEPLVIQLSSAVMLDEVKVSYRVKATEISTIDPIKMEQISEGELRKAACCNLSESFSTSPSVDVAFTDAVTGTRQIRLLGLASPYTFISRENMPGIRGLNAVQGLTHIPGPWVSSMQLNKGAGTVLNGYESIAGQINIEMHKPHTMDPLHVNIYVNEEGRKEANVNLSHALNEKWSTGLLLHGNHNDSRSDRNGDTFLDHTIGQGFAGLSRWAYRSGKNLEAQFHVMGTARDDIGGQMDFDPESNSTTPAYWGMDRKSRHIEGWGKIGWMFPLPWKSMGLQFSGSYHDEETKFGNTIYNGEQTSFYGNFIFQTILWNTNHNIKTGASFQYDKFNEILGELPFNRTEIVPGIYGEYTYKHLETFDVVAGLRVDHHNHFGPFITPRLHMRFAPADGTVLRGSVGRGFRTGAMIAENFGLLASSREWIFEQNSDTYHYGLNPEIAWNYGLNFTQNFRLDYRDGSFSVDAYRTDFKDRIVADLDESPQEVHFYNLQGKSFSNVLQAQVNYELLHNLDVRMAYRFIDAKTDYKSGLKQQPLQSRHRAFVNAGYTTRDQKWKLDATLNWQGEKRLPFTASNPVDYQLGDYSPSFYVLNSQVSRLWNRFEVYAGVENIFNKKQENPILGSDDPFGQYFDSSLTWGPVFGRNIYVGARYTIAKGE